MDAAARGPGIFGSPPRVWGRLVKRFEQRVHHRFTPTRVGTTGGRLRSIRYWSVHPHACGDDRRTLSSMVRPLGSPPRVWGRRELPVPLLLRRRFTPTRVGTTTAALSRPTCTTVHPHACGDDLFPAAHLPCRVGSPPRVWGRRLGNSDIWRHARFTPTRVGTTLYAVVQLRVSKVNTHACGDARREPEVAWL